MAFKPLIIRADASVEIGTGHAMRCLALAQAWQDSGGSCIFAMARSTAAVEVRLRDEHVEIAGISSAREAAEVVSLAQARGASWVAVDGYQFDTAYQRALKDAGLKLLFIDDGGKAEHYAADLVLNQNAHASRGLYASREPLTRLLLGPRYAMLRREFQQWREFKRDIPVEGRKVLITMGGSDPDNVTMRVIGAWSLAASDNMQATVVVGGSSSHFESLQSATKSFGNIRLLRNAPNMPELMAWADIAISAAGTTCWEMCLLGLPAILIDLAENQRPVAEELNRQKVAVHVGSTATAAAESVAKELRKLLNSPECRAEMCRRGQDMVDGRGSERVVGAIRGGTLRLRRVEEQDCKLLWEWSNDPTVRKVSFSTEPIRWERHVEWFRSKIGNENVLHYLAMNGDNLPVGQVRYELDGVRAVMSINLASGFRGKGYGSAMVAIATEELFRSSEARVIHAYVKTDNEASLRLFTQAGFSREATVAIRGQEAVHFVLERNSAL